MSVMMPLFVNNHDIPRLMMPKQDSGIWGYNNPFFWFWLYFWLGLARFNAAVKPLPFASLDEVDCEANDICNSHYSANDATSNHRRFCLVPMERGSFCRGLRENIGKRGGGICDF